MNKYIILFLYSIIILLLFTGSSDMFNSASLLAGAFIEDENAGHQEDFSTSVQETPKPSPSPVVPLNTTVSIVVEPPPENNKTAEESAPPSSTPEPQPRISALTNWYMSNETGIKVPILMYHNLLEGSAAGDSLNVSAEAFDDQMNQLKARGYNTITFSNLYDHYMNGSPLAENPVIITFDDGYESNYTIGYPILKKYGLKACIFVITDAIGHSNYLDEEQIREIASSGVIDIQSHSASHSYFLYSDTEENIADELLKSRSRIESITGKDVNVFCYTCGKYSQRLIDELIENEYIFSVTTKYGIASKKAHPFLLPRLRVLCIDSGKVLNAKITKLTGRVTKYIGIPEDMLAIDPNIEPDQPTDPGPDTNHPTGTEQEQPVESEFTSDQSIDSEPDQTDKLDSEESDVPEEEPESDIKPDIDSDDEDSRYEDSDPLVEPETDTDIEPMNGN